MLRRAHSPSNLRRSVIVLGAVALTVAVLAGQSPGYAGIPTPGQNINMVVGTTWPDGDPFLQRQNDPSIAISTRNGVNLLAGANDWRTVDLPVTGAVDINSDAWPGVFRSRDGGVTWKSSLLPGYPQDTSAPGATSPLKALNLTEATSPVVRSGPDGIFYYAGVAFNRATERRAIYISRFIDTNLSGASDPIRYIDTRVIDAGTAGQFIDKPWMFVDIPRAGATTCTIPVPDAPEQRIPAGNVYVVYSRSVGSKDAVSMMLMSRSTDCGRTWSKPMKISEGERLNQGASIAIDPALGRIVVAWRRFQSSSQTDAILAVTSTDFGNRFTKPVEVASIIPFDQPSTGTTFHTGTFPAIAAVPGRFYLAWSERISVGGEARVVITSSPDGLSWTSPTHVADGPVTDDTGRVYERGHQIMPAMTTVGGKVMIAFVGQYLDQTILRLHPNDPFVADDEGFFYRKDFDPAGDRVSTPDRLFREFISDADLVQRRHTLDTWLVQADATAAPHFGPPVRVSSYVAGTRAESTLVQLQFNPPNLPMFMQGTVVGGNNIDIAARSMVQVDGVWRFNTDDPAPVAVVTWTDNRDVRPPPDGNWSNYVPVGSQGGPSLFDPTQTVPPCEPGREGMRNQNVYSSTVTQGLLVESPVNVARVPSAATTPARFLITVSNQTGRDRVFSLRIATQPAGGFASFLPSVSSEVQCPGSLSFGTCERLDLVIPRRSAISRHVFATADNPAASVRVNVVEVQDIGQGDVQNGLRASILLNPDPAAIPLAGGGSTRLRVSAAFVGDPTGNNPSTPSADVLNPIILNPIIVNPIILNPIILNPIILNPIVSNSDIANPIILNTAPYDGVVCNTELTNPALVNMPVSDATYVVVHAGDEPASYRVRLHGDDPGIPLQLIITKPNINPTGNDCLLGVGAQNSVLANIRSIHPSRPTNLGDSGITDPRMENATFALEPGGLVLITVRAAAPPEMLYEMVSEMAPIVVAQAPPPAGEQPQVFAPLIVTTRSADLPAGTVGVPYTGSLEAIGGETPYRWDLVVGDLPPGLTLSPSGQVSGSPTMSGLFTITVRATDSRNPAASSTRELTFSIGP